jgi:nucleoside 2-deoxyribosyltransferase
MKFYLSGGMEYKKNLGMAWREWLTGELEKLKHDGVDPVKLESPDENGDPIQDRLTELKLAGEFDEVRRLARRFLFRKDMYGIQLSDALVVLYDKSVQRGAGTISEAWEAFREGKPVYLVTDFPTKSIPTWLIAETTSVFHDFEELLGYVSDHSRVVEDSVKARKARDEVLAGIY